MHVRDRVHVATGHAPPQDIPFVGFTCRGNHVRVTSVVVLTVSVPVGKACVG